MPFGPIPIHPLELNLVFTVNTVSQVFAAVIISMSQSEMRFVSGVTAQFELLLEHSAGSAGRRCPPSCPWLYHALDLFPLPPLLWSEGFSKLLPPS